MMVERKLNKIEGPAAHLPVYFTDEQLRWIERRAERLNMSKGAVVRTIVAGFIASTETQNVATS